MGGGGERRKCDKESARGKGRGGGSGGDGHRLEGGGGGESPIGEDVVVGSPVIHNKWRVH
jgi:hypothetical protein